MPVYVADEANAAGCCVPLLKLAAGRFQSKPNKGFKPVGFGLSSLACDVFFYLLLRNLTFGTLSNQFYFLVGSLLCD